MVALGDVFVPVKPDTKTFEPDLRRKLGKVSADGPGQQVGRTFAGGFGKSVGKIAALTAGAFAGLGAIRVFGSMISEAREAQKVSAQTAAVLSSTGAAAWISKGQVAALAEAMSLKAGVDDELIQSGANVLLTFKNIQNQAGAGNDIFDQATQATLDLSVALKKDMSSSAILVGKALNDPIKGMAALSRAGVQFTQQQKDQITAMVEAGDTLGAQKIIMAELTDQFEGSAAAQATAGDKLRVKWENFKETIGTAVLPILDRLFGFLMDHIIPALGTMAVWIGVHVVPKLREFGAWLNEHVVPALVALGTFIRDEGLPLLRQLAAWFGEEIVPKLSQFVSWMRDNVIPILVRLASWISETGIPALQQFGHWMSENERPIKVVAGVIATLLIPHFVALGAAAIAAQTKVVASWVAQTAAAVAATFAHSAAVVKQVAQWVFLGAQSLIHAGRVAAAWFIAAGPIAWVTAAVIALVVLIIAKWDSIKAATERIWGAVWSFLQGIGSRITSTVQGWVSSLTGWVMDKWTALSLGTSRIFSSMVSAVGRFFGSLLDKVKSPVRSVLNWINTHIIGNLNKLTSKFGLDIKPIKVGFNKGGLVPGDGPDKDSIMAMLTPGEGVIKRKRLKELASITGSSSKGVIERINRGDFSPLGVPGKGIVQGGQGGPFDVIGDAVSGVVSGIGNQLEGWLRSGAGFAMDKLLGPLVDGVASRTKEPPILRIVAGMMKQMKDKAVAWAKGKDSELDKPGLAGNGSGKITGQWMVPLIRGRYRVGRGGAGHGYPAQDLPVPTGSAVLASLAGTVYSIKRLAVSYGHHIRLRHGNGWTTLYAHLSRILVGLGQRVARGQIIGQSGSTGNSTGPHLHFETILNGRKREPAGLMRFDSGYGILPPGRTLVENNTGGPEPLMDPRKHGAQYHFHSPMEEMIAEIIRVLDRRDQGMLRPDWG